MDHSLFPWDLSGKNAGGGVVMPSSRGCFQPRNQTHISCVSYIAGGFFTTEPLRKPSLGTSSLTYVTYFACSICLCLCIYSSTHPFTSTFLVHQFLFFKEQRLAHANHLKKQQQQQNLVESIDLVLLQCFYRVLSLLYLKTYAILPQYQFVYRPVFSNRLWYHFILLSSQGQYQCYALSRHSEDSSSIK